MRKFKVDYDSIDGNWLVYIGLGLFAVSTVFFLFFISKWPYPLRPFLALALSYVISGGYILYGHRYQKQEIHTRKTFFLAGLGAYILWYALYVRASIYCNAGEAYHGGLAVLLVVSLTFKAYSFALKGNRFFWNRGENDRP